MVYIFTHLGSTQMPWNECKPLGYSDNERGRVEPGPNPFEPDKVLTMCPE